MHWSKTKFLLKITVYCIKMKEWFGLLRREATARTEGGMAPYTHTHTHTHPPPPPPPSPSTPAMCQLRAMATAMHAGQGNC